MLRGKEKEALSCGGKGAAPIPEFDIGATFLLNARKSREERLSGGLKFRGYNTADSVSLTQHNRGRNGS